MVKFSPEEKIQSVREYFNGNDGVKTIAKSIGVHHSVLHQWIKQYINLRVRFFGVKIKNDRIPMIHIRIKTKTSTDIIDRPFFLF